MDSSTQREAEISHVLQLLVELNESFAQDDNLGVNVYNIVMQGRIDTSMFDGVDPDIYNQIRSTVAQNEEIYRNITFASHSFLEENVESKFVAAAFFKDANGNVYFSARGTGEGRWVDNATLMYLPESQMQRATCDYFEQIMQRDFGEGSPFTGDLILSGHSKGGNDAQFITLFSKYREDIDLCFNFDGPGFSEEAYKLLLEELGSQEALDAHLQKIYGLVGENDYVFFRGREKLIPQDNIYVLNTPLAASFADYHYSHHMTGENGLNWQRDENGNIVNGTLGPIGEISVLLQEMEVHMPDDVYKATALSVMSLLEKFMGGGEGAGDIKFASPEDFLLFISEGLPFILKGKNGVPGLLERLARNGAFGEIIQQIVYGVEDPLSFIRQAGDIFQQAFTQIGQEILKTVDRIKIWTGEFINGLSESIRQGVDFVREKTAAFFAKVNDAIDSALALLSNMAEGVKGFVSGVLTAIGGTVSSLAESAAAAAQRVFSELKTGVENTVHVMISALNSAKDKAAEIAGSILKDLTSAVKAVVLGQKETWESILQDVISRLSAFTAWFEANIPNLIQVSIREVNNIFLNFQVEYAEVSKHSNINLTRRGSPVGVTGGATHSGSYPAALGNMKISVNLADLRKLRSQADDLLRELESRVRIAATARSLANDSMRQHSQSYVRHDGNAVISACAQLETDTGKARNELNTLMRGLAASIEGYDRLEREFA